MRFLQKSISENSMIKSISENSMFAYVVSTMFTSADKKNIRTSLQRGTHAYVARVKPKPVHKGLQPRRKDYRKQMLCCPASPFGDELYTPKLFATTKTAIFFLFAYFSLIICSSPEPKARIVNIQYSNSTSETPKKIPVQLVE